MPAACEVYKARDTRLDRTVAIKVLPTHLASDPDRRRRFEREAKTISSLNHPHICTLYDIGDQEGISFLVMEHLEGETLAERLARVGLLTTEDAVRCATEIASALDKAHTRQIIHRDLKPSNVMLTESGAKVLDFGIATRDADPELATVTRSVTALTDQGAIAGTVSYMAPEAVAWRTRRRAVRCLGAGRRPVRNARRPAAVYRLDGCGSHLGHPARPPAAVTQGGSERPGDHRAAVSEEGSHTTLSAGWGSRRRVAGGVDGADGLVLGRTAPISARRAGARRRGARGGRGVPGVEHPTLRQWTRDSRRSRAANRARRPAVRQPVGRRRAGLPLGGNDRRADHRAVEGALTVASRTAVRRFQDTNDTVPAIARTLGVDAVVSGSIVVAGDQVRVTAQLIDGTTEQNLWTESFDRQFVDILALQGEIAQAVAAEVRVAVTPEEAASLAATRPVNRLAYEAYLTGQYHARRWPDDLPQAVETFETAIVEDPAYAPAYAGLSVAYSLSAYYGSSVELPNPQRLPRAKDLADRALAVDDSLAQAHLANGIVKMAYEWDWAGAKAAFERSLALDPDDSSARMWYGCYVSWIEGRSADAVAYARQTLEQDPLSLDLNTRLAMFLYFAREFDEAIEVTEWVLERDPSYSDAKIWLAHAFAHAGRIDDAIARPDIANRFIGLVIADRVDEARRFLQPLVDRGDFGPLIGHQGGMYLSILGDLDGTFAALNNYEVGDALMTNLRVDPRMDLLRDDPRWDALMVRMGLPGF